MFKSGNFFPMTSIKGQLKALFYIYCTVLPLISGVVKNHDILTPSIF